MRNLVLGAIGSRTQHILRVKKNKGNMESIGSPEVISGLPRGASAQLANTIV